MTTTVPIECFVVEPTGIVARWLRRFTWSEGSGFTCEAGYHQAWKRIDDSPEMIDADGMLTNGTEQVSQFPASDWPPSCSTCSYLFPPSSTRTTTHQLFVDRLYARPGHPEAGGPWVNRWHSTEDGPPGLPPGAMFVADWNDHWLGPDGKCLVVILPTDVPEPWMVDGPATGGGHWTRSGVPPLVTVTPSIHAVGRGYHGHLQAGWLTVG